MPNEIIGDHNIIVRVKTGQVEIHDLLDSRHYIPVFSAEEALKVLDFLQRNKKRLQTAVQHAQAKKDAATADLPVIAWKHIMIRGDNLYYHNHTVCEPNFSAFQQGEIVPMTEEDTFELRGKYCDYCRGHILEGENKHVE